LESAIPACSTIQSYVIIQFFKKILKILKKVLVLKK